MAGKEQPIQYSDRRNMSRQRQFIGDLQSSGGGRPEGVIGGTELIACYRTLRFGTWYTSVSSGVRTIWHRVKCIHESHQFRCQTIHRLTMNLALSKSTVLWAIFNVIGITAWLCVGSITWPHHGIEGCAP